MATKESSVEGELEVPTVNRRRWRVLTKMHALQKSEKGPILYWMSRDQRVQGNWALIYAQHLAKRHSLPLVVCFCLVPKFLDATFRQYGFMLKGLKEVEEVLGRLKIPFKLLEGLAKDRLPQLVKELSVAAVVCDFSPLRVPLGWVKDVCVEMDKLSVPLIQVDAHNVVPCWVASTKQEYAARTIRSKIHSQLSQFLVEFPLMEEHTSSSTKKIKAMPVDWEAAEASLEVDRSVKEVSWATPGTAAGMATLEEFCLQRLRKFDKQRNDPCVNGLSNLSPWLHFGQIGAQQAILRVKECSNSSTKSSVDAFIEEALVRRELADNFCFYNLQYDQIEGAPSWAQETLAVHAKDERDHLYTEHQLEEAKTHDDLWNAAQIQMVQDGKMHGYLRMYWAKKILEWTSSPAEALRIAIKLNDKYELDGRDPNGYVGCMWSICGVHDQGWRERPVFGKIRYMNYNGCKRKFDVEEFERRYVNKEDERKPCAGKKRLAKTDDSGVVKRAKK